MTTTEKNPRTIINILIGLLVIAVMSARGQTFELQRAQVVDGKLKILSTKQYPLATVYKEQLKLARGLKPGEWLVGPTVLEDVEVAVKEVDDGPLTVSAEGFTPSEVEAIQRALDGWGRFTYLPSGGQIKIRRGSLKVAALSTMTFVDDRLVSADVVVDPSITNLDALQSAIAHEGGHWLGLPDNKDKDSVMYFKSQGRGRGNGHLKPTAKDLEAIHDTH